MDFRNNQMKEACDVVFLNLLGAPFPNYDSGISYFSLGVGYIQAFLHSQGINSIQIFQKEGVACNELVEKILKFKPKIVGFTCYVTNYYIIKVLSKKLKMRNPSLYIILGGPTPSSSSSVVLGDCPDIDICVRGEGEITLFELYNSIRNKMSLEKIKGITFRTDGRIIFNPDRELLWSSKKGGELDFMPSPYLTLQQERITDYSPISIISSRGCIYRCTYCNFATMWNHTVRFYSIDRVIEELIQIRKIIKLNKIKSNVTFHDDNFVLNTNRAKLICKRIIKERLNENLEFTCQFRADYADKELISLFNKANFKEFNFGLESAIPKELRAIKKITNRTDFINLTKEKRFVNKVKRYVLLAKQYGIKATVSVIFGLPKQTINSAQKTLRFIKNLRLHYYHHNFLFIFRGTELFKTYRNFDIRFHPSPWQFPLAISYKYNFMKKIKPFKNSSFYLHHANIYKIFKKIITGELKHNNHATSGFSTILLDNFFFKKEIHKKWISENLTIFGKFFLIYDDSKDYLLRPYRIHPFRAQHRLDMPSRNIIFCKRKFAESTNGFNNYYKIDLSGNANLPRNIIELVSNSYFLSVSSCFDLDFKKRKFIKAKKIKLFYLFKKKEEVGWLEKVGKEAHINKFLKKNFVDVQADFLDKCRWTESECPADCNSRIIIDRDGFLRPCFNAEPIGRIGDDYKIITKHLSRIKQKKRIERGCDNCKHNDRCPKCLFPFPLSDKEYCEKINNGSVQDIFKRIKALKYLSGEL